MKFKFILSCAYTHHSLFINHQKIPISDKEVISLFCLAFFFTSFPSEMNNSNNNKKKNHTYKNAHAERNTSYRVFVVIRHYTVVGHKRNAVYMHISKQKRLAETVVSYFDLMYIYGIRAGDISLWLNCKCIFTDRMRL